jgi:hypothetical protein
MARFYLDENVVEALAAVLVSLGHDAVTTNRIGTKGVKDPIQLVLAARMDRILLTHNGDDFGMLQLAWRAWANEWSVAAAARHAGILLLPQSRGLGASFLGRIVDEFVSTASAVENRLFAWNAVVGWHEVLWSPFLR